MDQSRFVLKHLLRHGEKKYMQDFGKPKYGVENWKTEYKMCFVKKRPKKIYKLNRQLDEYANETLLTIKAKNREEVYKFIAHYCNSDDHTYIASYLIDCYNNQEIREPEKLDLLCEKYRAKTGFFSVDPLKEAVKLYYFRPRYLYYAGCYKEEYLKFFKYLYENGYCIDLVKEKFPKQIYRQYFTWNDIETMLNIDCDDDDGTDQIWLIEEDYYEV